MKTSRNSNVIESIRPLYRLERRLRYFRDALWIFGAGWMILALAYAINPISPLNTATYFGALLGLAGALAFMALNLWIPQLEHRIALGLKDTPSGAAVVMLLHELDCDDESVYRSVSRILTRLLPLLETVSREELGEIQGELLRIDHRKPARLIDALLHAIVRFGDSSSIPVVEEFRRRLSPFNITSRIQSSTDRCLTVLKGSRSKDSKWPAARASR